VTDAADKDCARTCWLIGAGGGLLAGMMLAFMARMSLGLATVIAVVVAVALGSFLVWAFCTGRRELRPLQPRLAVPSPSPPEPAKVAALPVTEPLPISETSASGRTPLRPRTVTRLARTPAAGAARGGKRATGLVAAVSKSKAPVRMTQPETLTAPRGGRADDLKQITGIGPALERLLNDAGVWHFDQIASWKARDIAFIDSRMKGFKGRITRDGWVAQARELAARRPEDAV
jgi:predicted flap endonuclease-1-like 5' DNA nuclease